MYLTYDEYIQQGGALDSAAFSRLEYKAERIVDKRTLGRLKGEATVSEAVKRLVYELVTTLNDAEQRSSETVSSYSNDGVSVSYMKPPSEAEIASNIDCIIVDYLTGELTSGGVPLLYLGVC